MADQPASVAKKKDPDVIYAGWLIKAPPLKHAKERSTKRWRKRWFVLRRSMCRLSYYTEQACVEMKGEVDLKFSEKVVLNIDGGNKKNVWAIVFPDRDYFFQALNEADMVKWAHHIQEIFMLRAQQHNSDQPARPDVNAGAGPAPDPAQPAASQNQNQNTAREGRSRTNTMPMPHRGPSAAPPPPPPVETPAPAPKSEPVAEPVGAAEGPCWMHDGLTEADVPHLLITKPVGTYLVWRRDATSVLSVMTKGGNVSHFDIEEPDGAPCKIEGWAYGSEPGITALIDALHLPQEGWVTILGDFAARPGTAVAEIRSERRRSTVAKVTAISKTMFTAAEKEGGPADDDGSDDEDGSGGGGGDDTFDGEEPADAEASADAAGSGPALPAEWEQVMDSTTGDMYYHHKVTGATSWTHPGEVAVAEEAEAEKGAETGSSNPDDDWKEITADGQTYFHNEKTGQSSWSDPRKPTVAKAATILYDYTGAKAEELSVSANDKVTMTMADDGSGWLCIVKEDGTSGYVPASYLKFEEE